MIHINDLYYDNQEHNLSGDDFTYDENRYCEICGRKMTKYCERYEMYGTEILEPVWECDYC